MKIELDSSEIVKMIERFLTFPFPQICRHSVACDLLNLLEIHGVKITSELADAVVRAEDDVALDLIKELK